MSNSWDHYGSSAPPVTPREFLVSVELYISNAVGATLMRKPLPDRRKADRREDSKYREKSVPWSSLQKSLNVAGHWRSATCKLLEEGDRCLLNVYVDESILYQTIFIHLLNQTDIRQTDNSMFHKKDCLGIFCIGGGQRWTSSSVAEPIYIQFPNADTCSTWHALLKSYAIPEIYGRWFFPRDGGSYRMWRQVELTVLAGRNLGLTRHDPNHGDSNPDNEGADVDISCEIHLNDILCSRTTVKRGLGSPEWHESFTYPGLPPFENLEIVIWKEKKLTKPSIVGTARISLPNFRRGDAVEGWFPVMQTGASGNNTMHGELRLKIRVDEEIILPYASYSKLLQTCNSRSFLQWMADLESRLKLKSISSHLMSIAVATNVVIEQIQEYASREVETRAGSSHTLFRGNTTLTKTIELCMTWYGKAFLEASIGNVLRRLCAEKIAIEVDPMRSGKSNRDVERNVEQLIYWCQEFWNQIYSVREECPYEMRVLFKTIRKVVEQRYRPESMTPDSNTYLPWQSVSAFCFLRFIVPAILHPHLFGLCAGLPSVPVQRSLTLIAKVILSLANLNVGVQKESFMRGVQDFLRESSPAMIDYIVVVSKTPESETLPSTGHTADGMNRHDRLSIANALRERKKTMTTLDREAVLNLPHLVDIPRHLAIITSAVIRNSRDLSVRPRTGDDTDLAVDEFCSRCFEVEEEAILRVSQLATRLASENGRRQSLQGMMVAGSRISEPLEKEMPRSPISEVSSTVTSTVSRPSRRRASLRPATAPSTASSPIESSQPRLYPQFHENEAMSSNQRGYSMKPSKERIGWDEQNVRTLHHKSPSIDSFPAAARAPIIPTRLSQSTEVPNVEPADDPTKRKKGLLRGILRR